MAASATMQSCVVSPVAHCGLIKKHPSKASVCFPSARRRAMPVRCQAEEKGSPPEQPSAPTPIIPPETATPLPPKPKAGTGFSDLLAFNGPAPERINGRLAMLGFVAALGAELASGNDLSDQLMNGGVASFVVAAALLSVASLIPLSKGISVQSKSSGIWTADAEMWNGRFAMLGLVALAFTEYVKGGPFV